MHTAILDVDTGDITTFTASPTTANTLTAPSTSALPGTTEQAIQSLNRAAAGQLPTQQKAESLTLIAGLYRKTNRPDEALRAYQQLRNAIPLTDIEPNTALWVGRALISQSQHQAALPWLNAVNNRPDTQQPTPATLSESLFLTAQTQLHLQQNQQAAQTYQRLLATGGSYGDRGRLGLARALAATGNTEEAEGEYDGLVHNEASDIAAPALLESSLIKLNLAQRYTAAGDTTAAERLTFEAARRLHRVTILYDVPQLQSTVIHSFIALARLEKSRNETAKARNLLELAADRTPPESQTEATLWRNIARAERFLLDARRADALLLFKQVADSPPTDSPPATDARTRLDQLGATP